MLGGLGGGRLRYGLGERRNELQALRSPSHRGGEVRVNWKEQKAKCPPEKRKELRAIIAQYYRVLNHRKSNYRFVLGGFFR